MRPLVFLAVAVSIGVGVLWLSAAMAGKDAAGDGKATPTPASARAITAAAQEPMVDASEIVRHLGSAHQDVAGALSWDESRNTLIINVAGDPSQPGSPAAAFAADVRGAQPGVDVELRSVKFSTKQLGEVAERLTETRNEWAPGLQGWIYTAPDEEHGRVVVGVGQREVALWRQAAATLDQSVPVAVRAESPSGKGVILE